MNRPETTPDGTSPPLVYVRFRPVWAYIEGLREFGRFFCHLTFGESEVAERARVVIQEALENAVKYSEHDSDSDVELAISNLGNRLEISVTSRPDAVHIDRLRAEIAWINGNSAEHAYLSAFRRTADSPEAAARLGLARIRYEGKAAISMEVQEGGRVRVTAIGML